MQNLGIELINLLYRDSQLPFSRISMKYNFQEIPLMIEYAGEFHF